MKVVSPLTRMSPTYVFAMWLPKLSNSLPLAPVLIGTLYPIIGGEVIGLPAGIKSIVVFFYFTPSPSRLPYGSPQTHITYGSPQTYASHFACVSQSEVQKERIRSWCHQDPPLSPASPINFKTLPALLLLPVTYPGSWFTGAEGSFRSHFYRPEASDGGLDFVSP